MLHLTAEMLGLMMIAREMMLSSRLQNCNKTLVLLMSRALDNELLSYAV